MLSDEQVERALDWLRDSANDLGKAKEKAVLTERMVKHIKALEMKRHSDLGVAAQEREAFASKAYVDAVIEEAKAAGGYETMRALREAASAKIESWRSQSANFRAMNL